MRNFIQDRLSRPTLAIILSVGFGAGLMGCGKDSAGGVASSGTVIASGTADIGGPFTLVDQTGAVFTEVNLKGTPNLIYFGFSYCPDVCPTALQKMGAVQAALGDAGVGVNYIFISIDAERDTPESLAPYVGSRGFPSGLIGLSGTQAQIDAAVAAYRVYAQKVTDHESAAEFTFDHSDLILLMNSQGAFEDIFTHNNSVPEIAGRIRLLRNKEG
jgi:protein SCO1/2